MLRLNDGSQRPARLQIQQSWTATSGLPTPNAASADTEARFALIAAAGFAGIHGRLPPLAERVRWRSVLDRYQLSFGALLFPAQGADLLRLLQEAKDFGASYANCQVQGRYLRLDAACTLLEGLLEAEQGSQLPCFVETHRGSVTQDLLRTLDLLVRLPALRLTLDLSHYVLALELGPWAVDAELQQHFWPLFERTGSLHGRIAGPEQIQLQLDSQMRPHFVAWWQATMAHWRNTANDGDILPFVCELLPPAYAIQVAGAEVSDRWQMALQLKAMAEAAWQATPP
jgi:hypothetical protein